ncbi:unnamed protein product [Mytilus coruscus]|uniref:Uncharacterized protein n=1 Tax=Mytilus coruscus TaxID=42192 RepID=A0A6J8DBN3_MYTCO|nr:unnamed protein product [Mytilus coruscus]
MHDNLNSCLRTLLSSTDVMGRTPWNLMIVGDGFYYTSASNLRKIFSFGVSPEGNDNLKNTVLHRICGVSHGDAYVDVLEYLLEIGAYINAQNIYGEPVLSLTLSEQILETFLKFNADCSIKDKWGGSSLISIMKYRPLPDLLRTFIVKGTINVNNRDIYGFTALHIVAYHNYEEQIEILLKYGADINACDNIQERPLDTAKRHRSFRCIALLKMANITFIGHTMSFTQLTLRALNEPHLWKEGYFYFNVENKSGKVFGKPVFTFDVYWLGSIYKQLRISIDLVPAVYKRGWWPPNIDVDNIPLIKSAGCFLTLQTKTQPFAPNDWDCISRTCNNEDNAELTEKKMLRISAAPAEICLMKSLPNEFRKAYILAKVLKTYVLKLILKQNNTSWRKKTANMQNRVGQTHLN